MNLVIKFFIGLLITVFFSSCSNSTRIEINKDETSPQWDEYISEKSNVDSVHVVFSAYDSKINDMDIVWLDKNNSVVKSLNIPVTYTLKEHHLVLDKSILEKSECNKYAFGLKVQTNNDVIKIQEINREIINGGNYYVQYIDYTYQDAFLIICLVAAIIFILFPK